MRAGAARAVRARRRAGVGRVSSGADEDEDVDEGRVVVLVANRSNAARMEASVEAVIRCCLAREEGGSLGAGKREEGGGGARERRLGGCDEGGGRLVTFLCRGDLRAGTGIPGTYHSVELGDERDQRRGRLSERRWPVRPRHCGSCRG